jgi:hypothetical protein
MTPPRYDLPPPQRVIVVKLLKVLLAEVTSDAASGSDRMHNQVAASSLRAPALEIVSTPDTHCSGTPLFRAGAIPHFPELLRPLDKPPLPPLMLFSRHSRIEERFQLSIC